MLTKRRQRITTKHAEHREGKKENITPEFAEGAEAAPVDFSGVDMTTGDTTPELNDWDYATSAVEWADTADQNGQATNEPTQQGNNAANQNAQQNNNATGNNTQNQPEAEQPGDSDPTTTTPWDVDNDVNNAPYSNVQSAIDDVNNVNRANAYSGLTIPTILPETGHYKRLKSFFIAMTHRREQ